MAEDQERWSYVIELAFDPENPPPEEDQARLRRVFEFISEGVKRLMNPETGPEELEDFKEVTRWH
jgi:hypothetical protein